MWWKTFVLPKFKRRYFYFAISALVIAALAVGLAEHAEWSKQDVPKPITRGNETKPKVAFACNVFWGEEVLPGLLKVLAQNDVRITFFLGGSWVKKNPDLVKDMAAAGHELGNHSYSHPHPNSLTKAQNQEQILQTEKLILDLTGVKTRLYAPPYGEYNNDVLAAAREIGYTTIMWSIDTIDWQRPPQEKIKERVFSKLSNGAIILMHPTAPTLAALPELISEIKRKGYTVTTVSDVLN